MVLIQLLVAKRANPSHRDRAGRTPLLEAIEAAHDPVLQLFDRNQNLHFYFIAILGHKISLRKGSSAWA